MPVPFLREGAGDVRGVRAWNSWDSVRYAGEWEGMWAGGADHVGHVYWRIMGRKGDQSFIYFFLFPFLILFHTRPLFDTV